MFEYFNISGRTEETWKNTKILSVSGTTIFPEIRDAEATGIVGHTHVFLNFF